MSSVVKDIAKAPGKIAKESKTIVKQSIKPANKHDMYQIAIGSVAGGLLTVVYNKVAGIVMNFLPFKNETLTNVVRAILPFGLSYVVWKFKIPFGNILAGGFLGVGITNVLKWIIDALKGKVSLPLGTPKTVDAKDLELASTEGTDYAEF